MAVPDPSRNHEDAYLVHSMAHDPLLNSHFKELLENEKFLNDVTEFASLGPVFQVLWLRNKGVNPWHMAEGESRSEYVSRIFRDKDPFHRLPKGTFPAFAPACAWTHLSEGKPIPHDWQHLLHMIYQVRCNLFHGGKSYESAADQVFVDFAFKILWRVWRQVVPTHYAGHAGLRGWDSLFVRSGIVFKRSGGELDLSGETDQNRQFIRRVLDEIGWGNRLEKRVELFEVNVFRVPDEMADEQEWLDAWEKCRGGAEGGPLGFDKIELEIMDTYLSGIVRWTNALGYITTISCDGHGKNPPRFELDDPSQELEVSEIIKQESVGGIILRDGKFFRTDRNVASGAEWPSQSELLKLAERLHNRFIRQQSAT